MNYSAILNTFTGELQLVNALSAFTLKGVVATTASLPLSGNTENDCYIVSADDRIYTWNSASSTGLITDWKDIGSVTSVAWSAITGKPSSSISDIDDAVSKKHTQNTDTGTTQQTFQLQSGSSGIKIKNNAGTFEIRISADNAYAAARILSLVLGNNFALSGRNAADGANVDIVKVNTSNQVEILSDFISGGLSAAENGGVVTIFDESVTSASSDGTEHGADIKIDASSILKISAESDASGGLKNKKVTTTGTFKAAAIQSSDGTAALVSGTFTEHTGKTVTVKDGLIVSIV
jgi:DNA/RNA endonuclease YhcR with UshA esterase domain